MVNHHVSVITFRHFLKKYTGENEGGRNIKIERRIFSIDRLVSLELCLIDGPFHIDTGFVNLDPMKGTQSNVYVEKNRCDPSSCPPENLNKYVLSFEKKNGCVNIRNVKFNDYQVFLPLDP